MIDVTMHNFEADVIAASQTTPVLVDFWADWCGPCKSLGPLLEKLEVAYEGRFKLAKVNADVEQELASAFGIKSLPTCILLMGGRPVDGFMGVVPEGKVREFLDKHLPAAAELEAIEEVDEAQALLEAGDPQAHAPGPLTLLDDGDGELTSRTRRRSRSRSRCRRRARCSCRSSPRTSGTTRREARPCCRARRGWRRPCRAAARRC